MEEKLEILVKPTKEIRAGLLRIKNNFRRIDTLNRRSLHDKVILLLIHFFDPLFRSKNGAECGVYFEMT